MWNSPDDRRNRHGLAVLTLALLVILGSYPAISFSQTPRAKVRMSLDFEHHVGVEYILKATVRTKPDRSYVPVPAVEVEFFKRTDTSMVAMGTAITGDDGVARFAVSSEVMTREYHEWHEFSARITDNDAFQDAERTTSVKLAFIETDLTNVGDSTYILGLQVSSLDSLGQTATLPEIPIQIYVQRLFGLLPVIEYPEITNEEGEITVNFPTDIPGDSEGIVEIVMVVEDHDAFGTVSLRRKAQWGVPLDVLNKEQQRRELWSARSTVPIYLLLICNGMILAIWGTIVYLILQVLKIRQLGKIGKDDMTNQVHIEM